VTRIIAIANQKGGVGKTTTAISLSAEIASRGPRCLLIDLDPQANATAGLGIVPNGPTIYDVLIDELKLSEVLLPTLQEGLLLAPSSPDLAGAEVELVPAMAREYRLKRALEPEVEAFDYVIIDCPPSLGLLTLNALTAAREALVPVQCEYLALEGLGQLSRTLEAVRQNLNPGLHISGLLLTMYDSRTNLSEQVAQEVRNHFPNTFRTVIPRSVRASEAPSHGLPLSKYAPSSPAAKAYRSFAMELMKMSSAEPASSEAKR
jgi:chromosome partitioning protein